MAILWVLLNCEFSGERKIAISEKKELQNYKSQGLQKWHCQKIKRAGGRWLHGAVCLTIYSHCVKNNISPRVKEWPNITFIFCTSQIWCNLKYEWCWKFFLGNNLLLYLRTLTIRKVNIFIVTNMRKYKVTNIYPPFNLVQPVIADVVDT